MIFVAEAAAAAAAAAAALVEDKQASAGDERAAGDKGVEGTPADADIELPKRELAAAEDKTEPVADGQRTADLPTVEEDQTAIDFASRADDHTLQNKPLASNDVIPASRQTESSARIKKRRRSPRREPIHHPVDGLPEKPVEKPPPDGELFASAVDGRFVAEDGATDSGGPAEEVPSEALNTASDEISSVEATSAEALIESEPSETGKTTEQMSAVNVEESSVNDAVIEQPGSVNDMDNFIEKIMKKFDARDGLKASGELSTGTEPLDKFDADEEGSMHGVVLSDKELNGKPEAFCLLPMPMQSRGAVEWDKQLQIVAGYKARSGRKDPRGDEIQSVITRQAGVMRQLFSLNTGLAEVDEDLEEMKRSLQRHRNDADRRFNELKNKKLSDDDDGDDLPNDIDRWMSERRTKSSSTNDLRRSTYRTLCKSNDDKVSSRSPARISDGTSLTNSTKSDETDELRYKSKYPSILKNVYNETRRTMLDSNKMTKEIWDEKMKEIRQGIPEALKCVGNEMDRSSKFAYKPLSATKSHSDNDKSFYSNEVVKDDKSKCSDDKTTGFQRTLISSQDSKTRFALSDHGGAGRGMYTVNYKAPTHQHSLKYRAQKNSNRAKYVIPTKYRRFDSDHVDSRRDVGRPMRVETEEDMLESVIDEDYRRFVSNYNDARRGTGYRPARSISLSDLRSLTSDGFITHTDGDEGYCYMCGEFEEGKKSTSNSKNSVQHHVQQYDQHTPVILTTHKEYYVDGKVSDADVSTSIGYSRRHDDATPAAPAIHLDQVLVNKIGEKNVRSKPSHQIKSRFLKRTR